VTESSRARRVLRRLRAPALNVGLAIVSVGVAGLLAEGVIRLFAPQQLILIRPDLWQPADTVGWLHRPNVDLRINTGERTVRIVTDEDGFRVGAGGARNAESRVLVLGDSFMEALQVEHEQSAASLLEASLTQLTAAPVVVRNAGIGGWDPDQYALRARALLARDDYDLVITALYLGNDIIARRRDDVPAREPVTRYRFRPPRGLSGRELTDAMLRPINDFLEVRSHLFIFVRSRLQTLRMKVGLTPLDFPPAFLTPETEGIRWDVTADLCAAIDSMAARHGADALFVLIPAPFQVDSADLRSYVEGFDLDLRTIDLEQPNRELGRELAERGLMVSDLLEPFRGAHEAGHRLYGAIDPHFTPSGHRLFAESVGPLAAELLSSPPETDAMSSPLPR
jgi:lysophospholipase L1-like esterase